MTRNTPSRLYINMLADTSTDCPSGQKSSDQPSPWPVIHTHGKVKKTEQRAQKHSQHKGYFALKTQVYLSEGVIEKHYPFLSAFDSWLPAKPPADKPELGPCNPALTEPSSPPRFRPLACLAFGRAMTSSCYAFATLLRYIRGCRTNKSLFNSGHTRRSN